LAAFAHVATPPWLVNVTGPERLSVRDLCERLGALLNKPVRFAGTESTTALLSNAEQGLRLLGPPQVSVDRLIEWVAHWVARGGCSLDKPTHFESRDGRLCVVMGDKLDPRIAHALQRGLVILACPLALTAERRLDERRQ